MLFDDTYQTIEKPAEAIFRDRGSKFMAYAYPVLQESEVKNIIALIKTLQPKATHYCWALRLTTDRSIFRVNDDGEPSGTAGRPILNALLSRNVTNILVVVVRYFGGTLLGVPGLINAYKTAAEQALNAATVIEKTVNDVYRIDFDYLLMNDVMRLIKEDDLNIIQQQLDNNCSITLSIRKMQVNQTLKKLELLREVSVSYQYSG